MQMQVQQRSTLEPAPIPPSITSNLQSPGHSILQLPLSHSPTTRACRRRTARGHIVLAAFSSYPSRFLAPAATTHNHGHSHWLSPGLTGPLGLLRQRALALKPNQTTDHCWSTSQSSKNRANLVGPVPTPGQSTLAQTVAGEQPTAPCYSPKAR
jgi:hypothetical protein